MKTAHPKAANLSVVSAPSNAVQSIAQTDNQTASTATNHIGILRAVLGSLQDGFIIASQSGEIHQINQPAERICNLLAAKDNQLPNEIWSVCQTALSNQNVLSFSKIGFDAEIILPNLGAVRIRVQNISIGQTPCLLIVLEDRQQTIRNKALSDAALYGLTERETEVWQMRIRGAAYKEISAALWISIDTVKKHVKNIHAKKQSHQDDLEYALMA
ncbi:MAG: helix-turn-helix transcriptional regulator [Cyanobacteria bacterium J06632_3]